MTTLRYPLKKAIEIECYELNTRQRLNRIFPLEDAIKSDLEIEQPDTS